MSDQRGYYWRHIIQFLDVKIAYFFFLILYFPQLETDFHETSHFCFTEFGKYICYFVLQLNLELNANRELCYNPHLLHTDYGCFQ